MAITYNNVFNDYVVEPLMEIMSGEFLGMPIRLEEPGGSQSFHLTPNNDSLEELRGRGQLRSYGVEVIYRYEKGGSYDKEVVNQLSIIAERFKRLIDNNRNFSVKSHWVDEHGTWGSTSTVWSANRDTYCWHSARVESIDYEQDEEDKNTRIVKMQFECFREEVL